MWSSYSMKTSVPMGNVAAVLLHVNTDAQLTEVSKQQDDEMGAKFSSGCRAQSASRSSGSESSWGACASAAAARQARGSWRARHRRLCRCRCRCRYPSTPGKSPTRSRPKDAKVARASGRSEDLQGSIGPSSEDASLSLNWSTFVKKTIAGPGAPPGPLVRPRDHAHGIGSPAHGVRC